MLEKARTRVATTWTKAQEAIWAKGPRIDRSIDAHEPGIVGVGDSIEFGDNPNLPKDNPDLFIGYPDAVAQDEGWKSANFGDPGESSESLLTEKNSNGAWIQDPQDPSKLIHPRPLHINYEIPQIDAVLDYLKTHADTKLLTMSIGGNDLLLLQKASEHGIIPQPVQELARLPITLAHLYLNTRKALGEIRQVYTGPIVVNNQYALDYSKGLDTFGLRAANWALAQAVKAANEKGEPAAIADQFAAFKKVVDATPSAHGNSGEAGLLLPYNHPDQKWDIHPSAAGRAVLAKTVEAADPYLSAPA